MFATRPLEFDRIVAEVTALSATPMGRARLEALEPAADPRTVAARQESTTETVRFLEQNAGFPLRAGQGLVGALEELAIEGRPLDPLALRALADFVDSVERSRAGILGAKGEFPVLSALARRLTSFKAEIGAVREAIDGSGEVLDAASPALRGIRESLRQRRQRLRQTLEQFARGRDTAKYLQEEVITERNGRFVLLVRAEHRANVPGIVHGSSASGASLFLEPAATVEINNDIVELEEREREEIFRILLALTDRFRHRPGDVRAVEEVAAELDVLQSRARYSTRVGGVEPTFVADGSFELRGARHPLVEQPVPIDVVLDPPSRVLLITGPNTGGKTVALKTAGLFALMAQAGLHVPAATARLPVFRSIFADIGDEQSIAASLSTFSAHISNLVSMDRALDLPSLVLLDEVGTGTDPNEGGALATALVQHFRQRGAHLIATTHFDAVKTWGTTTDGVTVAGFAFDPQTYAPTYRLIYGAPGRSLAIEIAQRLGLPLAVVAAARGFLSDDQKRLQARLDRVDAQARALEAERGRLERDRRAAADERKVLEARERTLAEREEAFKKRLNEKIEERVRQARRDIDTVIDQLRDKSDALVEKASLRAAGALVNTGEAGAARAEARAAVERIAEGLRQPVAAWTGVSVAGTEASVAGTEVPALQGVPAPQRGAGSGSAEASAPAAAVGARVAVGGFGLEGIVVSIQGSHVEVDVRGKRLRARLRDVRVLAPPAPAAAGKVRVTVDLKPREGMLSEINVIGCTVDEAMDRVSRFLDDTMVTGMLEIRIVHGFGTGQLRRGLHAYLKEHPLVAHYGPAPENQGGGGATVVTIKE
ncbi:MAG TPA: Smr/MutS family protein [Vicinamibacterales bacterium]|nr:Smr/MutS family protein [Vicinamibacterales bacterium]